MRYVIIFLSVFIFSGFSYSATLHVPSEYTTIQEAIDAALDGDAVLVAPGTYIENIDFKGKAITVESDQGPEITIIDGNDSGSVVWFHSGEGQDSILNGFTISNGSDSDFGGGGIHCGSNCSPIVINNIILLFHGAY